MQYLWVVDCEHHLPCIFESCNEAVEYAKSLEKDKNSGRIWLIRNQVMTNPKTGKLSWHYDGGNAQFWK